MLDMERANQLLASAEPSLADMGPAIWWVAGLGLILGVIGGLLEWAKRSKK